MAELSESSGDFVVVGKDGEEFPSSPDVKDAAKTTLKGATHTDCRSGAVATPTTHTIGGDVMTFVPFAHFKTGGQVFTKSVGYHSDGDVVLLKEDISSSDSELKTRDAADRKNFVLTTTSRVEQPLNQNKIEARGIRAFPGVTGPKGKQKHRRWRNQFFVDEDAVGLLDTMERKGNNGKMTKQEFQELFTHRHDAAFQFHNDDGDVDRKWAPFVEVTEEKQMALLKKYSANKPAAKAVPSTGGEALTPSQRWGKINKPLRGELVRLKNKRETFFEPVEARLLQFIRDLEQSRVDCTEVSPLVLLLNDGYHRMLCHGVVTYYGLVSYSETGDDGERFTLVHPPKNYPTPFPVPEISLNEFLTAEPSQKQLPQVSKRRKMKRKQRPSSNAP